MITTNKANSPSIATDFAISVFLLLVVYIFFDFYYFTIYPLKLCVAEFISGP